MGHIREFLVAAEELPTPRGTAARLLQVAADPDSDFEDLVKVVRSDPALAAFILRAANAARFGRSPVALDLHQALLRLGFDVVRSHAITLSMMSSQPRILCEAFDYPLFWIRSLLTGVAMERLSSRMDGLSASESFSLGLLTDIGRLAFATAAPVAYIPIATRLSQGASDEELCGLEESHFGFDHYELSAVLLSDWGIPEKMASVVYWQRRPEASGFDTVSRTYRLACALQLASRLAACLVPSPFLPDTATLFLCSASCGLNPDQVRAWTQESVTEFYEWAHIAGMKTDSLLRIPADLACAESS
jgi:HD-like signal output (HDOD) protein